MHSVPRWLRTHGRIARRRDLLRAGFTDHGIRTALARGAIFRIRHGWYGTPDLDTIVRRVVRVGGQLTGVAALRMRGLFLPEPSVLEVAVPRNAARLRSAENFRRRLGSTAPVRVHWTSPPRGFRPPRDWLATESDALDVILRTADRELAVAACDGLMRYRNWTRRDIDAAFDRAPKRTHAWRSLVDGRADSWGESFLRIRALDAGLAFEPQARVPGAGAFDGRVSERVYLEVDGAQHSDDWTGDEPGSFQRDREKDLVVCALGGRVIRIGYAQLMDDWPLCLSAITRAVDDDRRALAAQRKRRTRRGHADEDVHRGGAPPESPSFS